MQRVPERLKLGSFWKKGTSWNGHLLHIGAGEKP
jgi:hypothetical protein